MKILIATSYGFNLRMRNFIEFIVARLLSQKGWQVTAVAEPEQNKKEYFRTDGNISVFKNPSKISIFIFLLKKFIWDRPDIVHVFNMRNNRQGILAAIFSKIFRVPLVFTEYGLLHDHYLITDRDNPYPLNEKLIIDGPILSFLKIFKNRQIKNNLKNYLFHFGLARADSIIFISKHNLEIAEKLGLRNAIYLPHLFDNQRWPDQDKTALEEGKRTQMESNKGKNFILFIGQLKLRKGWDIMLEATKNIDDKLNICLLFVTASANKEEKELGQKIDALGIRDKIIFLGKVDGYALKEVYEKSAVIVVPSLYEGFGLAVTEAWEMKKPVIASDVPAINEHLINEVNGLSVPPGDPISLALAIEKIFKNPDLRQKITKGGLNTLEKLKSQETQNQWLDFYKSLIKK